MLERIIIAGSGGQGIMLLGKVLAEAGMREGRYVTWFPSYGAEVRGGTAHCFVIISDEEIGSPCVEEADALIAMNDLSLRKFKARVRKGGLLVINSSLTGKGAKIKGIRAVSAPFTEMAIGLGNIRVANMVALGAFLKNRTLVKLDTIYKVFQDFAPQGKEGLVRINRLALEKGMD